MPQEQSRVCDTFEEFKRSTLFKREQLLAYPSLTKMFRQYNTVLPSSAAVERLFSVGGGIFRKNRYCLTDESFEMQLLLKLNKNVV